MWMRSTCSGVWIRSIGKWMISSRVQCIVEYTLVNPCSSVGLSGAVSSSYYKQLLVSGHIKVSSIFQVLILKSLNNPISGLALLRSSYGFLSFFPHFVFFLSAKTQLYSLVFFLNIKGPNCVFIYSLWLNFTLLFNAD